MTHVKRILPALVLGLMFTILLGLIGESPIRTVYKIAVLAFGVIFAHFLRLTIFPYIDLSYILRKNPLAGAVIIAGWYGGFIIAFALVI